MAEKPPAAGAPSPQDKVGTLIGEFLEEKKREQEEAAKRAVPPRRRPIVLTLLVVLCLATAAATVFLQAPESPIPADRIEAGTRVSIFLASERIRDFQRRTGRLPASLAEARVDTARLSYWRSTDSVFELWSEVAGQRLRYRSTMPGAEFLGASLRIIGQTP